MCRRIERRVNEGTAVFHAEASSFIKRRVGDWPGLGGWFVVFGMPFVVIA